MCIGVHKELARLPEQLCAQVAWPYLSSLDMPLHGYFNLCHIPTKKMCSLAQTQVQLTIMMICLISSD